MRLPEWILEQIRSLGHELINRPEDFTGNLTVNSFKGGVTNLNFGVSFKPFNENGELQELRQKTE